MDFSNGYIVTQSIHIFLMDTSNLLDMVVLAAGTSYYGSAAIDLAQNPMMVLEVTSTTNDGNA